MLEERMVGRLCLADQQEEHLRRWLDYFTLMQEDSWPCVFLGGHVKNQISYHGQGWRRQYVLWSSKSWRSQLGPGKSDQGPQQNGSKTQKCKKYLCWRWNSTICQDPTKIQKRIAGLVSSEQSSAPQGYDGRGSGGRFGRGGAYTGTTVKQIQRHTSVIHLDLYTLEHLNTSHWKSVCHLPIVMMMNQPKGIISQMKMWKTKAFWTLPIAIIFSHIWCGLN